MGLKKTIIASLLTTSLVLSSSIFIFAIDSDADVNFTEPIDTVPIRNPDTPETILYNDSSDANVDSDNPKLGISGTQGSLTVDYMTPISFNTQSVSNENHAYYVNAQKPFAQITDRRGLGKGTGWKITAKVSNFQSNNSLSLTGSSIVFKNLHFAFAPNSVPIGYDSTNPTAPYTPNSVLLLAGDTHEKAFVYAKSNEGMGTWLIRYYDPTKYLQGTQAVNTNISLLVPNNFDITANHSAIITWNITKGP